MPVIRQNRTVMRLREVVQKCSGGRKTFGRIYEQLSIFQMRKYRIESALYAPSGVFIISYGDQSRTITVMAAKPVHSLFKPLHPVFFLFFAVIKQNMETK